MAVRRWSREAYPLIVVHRNHRGFGPVPRLVDLHAVAPVHVTAAAAADAVAVVLSWVGVASLVSLVGAITFSVLAGGGGCRSVSHAIVKGSQGRLVGTKLIDRLQNQGGGGCMETVFLLCYVM